MQVHIWQIIKNGRLSIATQRLFCIHCVLGWHDHVPDEKAFYTWTWHISETGSVYNRKSPGHSHNATVLENLALVWNSIQWPPHRSPQHVTTLHLSQLSVCRILHRDLKMNPYKIVMAQELNDNKIVSRNSSKCAPHRCHTILRRSPFSSVRCSKKNRIWETGLKTTPKTSPTFSS